MGMSKVENINIEEALDVLTVASTYSLVSEAPTKVAKLINKFIEQTNTGVVIVGSNDHAAKLIDTDELYIDSSFESDGKKSKLADVTIIIENEKYFNAFQKALPKPILKTETKVDVIVTFWHPTNKVVMVFKPSSNK